MPDINVEQLLKDSPVYYMDGGVEMRLILVPKPVNAVCLEWKCGEEWVEVSSMRTLAFDALLERYSTLSKGNRATVNTGKSTPDYEGE